jgi:hypothetical protein
MDLEVMSWLRSDYWLLNTENYFWRDGMNTLAIKFDDHAIDVSFTKTSLHFILADGREISAPLEWFPKLRDATASERQEWRFIGNGIGVHWSKIDEDVSVRSLMTQND